MFTGSVPVFNDGDTAVFESLSPPGNLVGVKSVENDDELMLITTEGIIIRIQVSDVTVLGRITTGVKLINLKEGVSVASIAKVVEDKTLMPPEEAKEEADESEENNTEA